MPSNNPYLTSIHPIYTIWFLYLEPIFALGGTYLCIYQPLLLLRGTMPLPAFTHYSSTLSPSSDPATPLISMLLTNIGALYFLFAIVEGGVLRLTKEKKIWVAVMTALLVSDVGHIYAVWKIAPERMVFGEMGNWTSDEWINYGTLVGGMFLRGAFVAGVGRS